MDDIFNNREITYIVEFIENKFYFATSYVGKCFLRDTATTHFFTIDNELVYKNFYNDFGPLNLGCLYKYCCIINDKLNHPFYKRKRIVHYTSLNEKKRANAVFLIASFAVIYLNKTPEEIYDAFNSPNLPPLKSFQDASLASSNYTINLLDCLHAIFKAMFYGFINFNDFDISEYEKFSHFQKGDLHWIIPQKFIAFLGPSTEIATPYQPPERYIDYFIKNNVVAVVRLSRVTYPANRFTIAGIEHYDLFIPDGSIPSSSQMEQFLHLSEITNGAVAVHCKAGLGRTGSLIATYLIKHYKMTAREAIAWLRICRPGSVIGHQQTWLESVEKELWQAGDQQRLRLFQDKNKIIRHQRGIYSIRFNREKAQQNFSNVLHQLNNSNRCLMQIQQPATVTQNMLELTIKPNMKSVGCITQGDELNAIKLKRSYQNYLLHLRKQAYKLA